MKYIFLYRLLSLLNSAAAHIYAILETPPVKRQTGLRMSAIRHYTGISSVTHLQSILSVHKTGLRVAGKTPADIPEVARLAFDGKPQPHSAKTAKLP